MPGVSEREWAARRRRGGRFRRTEELSGGLCASVSGVPAVAVCGGFAREVFILNAKETVPSDVSCCGPACALMLLYLGCSLIIRRCRRSAGYHIVSDVVSVRHGHRTLSETIII